MHDIRFIRDNPDTFKRGLARRGLNSEEILKEIEQLDSQRRANIALVQKWQEDRNRKSKEIGQAKAAGDEARVAQLMQEVSRLKSDIANAGAQVSDETTGKLKEKLAEIPNLPLDEVPDGKDEKDNVEHHSFGAKRDYAFASKQHFDLGEALGQMDFETAAKLSGARFVVLKKGLARLERALSQFMLDVHTSDPHNYIEVSPPILVRGEAMYGTAQLPKFLEDQFSVQAGSPGKYFLEFLKAGGEIGDMEGLAVPFWLIPTAEVPLTNLVRESILDEAQLPMRLTACTPCFRAEAGAAGKDTRGMIRQHQFTKVELVSITTPERSKDEHERMLACAEEVLRRLDLHYRVVTLCTGDMGFASQKTYDIEVWLPGQNMYREISSCSVCGDFQARRMNARYRPKHLTGGALIGSMRLNAATFNQPPARATPRYVHTLNGSGVAVGRALIAVMETYQQQDGSIVVPDALAPYMGGIKRIEK